MTLISCHTALPILDAVLRISQGLLTPVVAAIAAYIAWQQYAVNRDKLKLDLYHKRLNVYQALSQFIGSIMVHGDLKYEALRDFDSGRAEADFVFADDEAIRNLIINIRNVSLSVMASNVEYRDWSQEAPPGYDHRHVVETKHDGLRWLAEQQDVARKLFKPYLSLRS